MILNEKHYRCIEMICQPDTHITDVSRELGVSRTTIYSWMKDTQFKAALDEAEQEIKNRVRHIFLQKLPAAVDKLWKLTDSQDNRTAIRAVNDWIDRAIGKVSTFVTVEDKRTDDDDFDIERALKEIREEEARKNTPA